jgi:hypothetical protein
MDAEFDPLALNTDVRDFLGSNVAHFHPGDKEEFYKFSSARVSARTLTLATILAMAIIIYYFTMGFFRASLIHDISFAPALFTMLIRFPIGMIMLYIRKKIDRKEVISPFLDGVGKFCESAHIMGSSLTPALFLFGRLYNGECPSLNQLDMWSCNSGFASHTLPQEFVVLLMMQPLCYSVAFKSLKFELVMVTWFIVVFTLFVGVGMVGAYQSLPAILIYIPVSLVLLLENHRQDLILFFVVKSQRKLLAENKKMSEERTTEMRHMIANVAHDLKTVSLLFTSSCNLIPLFSRCPPS